MNYELKNTMDKEIEELIIQTEFQLRLNALKKEVAE
jgi:hypothetical protein